MRAIILALALISAAEPTPYRAIDGDTIAVGTGPHIRLLVIDAPEMPGHCHPGRHCVSGDPYAAQRYLQSLLRHGPMTCVDGDERGRKIDVYGRRLSHCSIRGVGDLSAAMLRSGLVGLYHPPSYWRHS